MTDAPRTLLVVAFLGAAGCGDDATAGDASGSTGQTEGTSAGSGTGSGSQGTGSSTGSTTGPMIHDVGGGSSTGGPTPVRLWGLVEDRATDTPIVGADIEVWGMPSFTAQSGADGSYELVGLPPDTEVFVLVLPSTDYWGGVVPVLTASGGDQEQALAQVPRSLVDAWRMDVEAMGTQMLDDTKPAVLGRVIQNTAVGTSISLVPAPAMDTYFAPDADGNLLLNSNVAEFSLFPVVVFANLLAGDPGTYTASAMHPMRECTVPHPEFPTIGGYVTLVDADCPPMP